MSILYIMSCCTFLTYLGDDCYVSIYTLDHLYTNPVSYMGFNRYSFTIFYHISQ